MAKLILVFDSEEAFPKRLVPYPSDPAAADITDATEDGIALITSADANPFTDADELKLDGIETGADVTDAANVVAAGALTHTQISGEGLVVSGTENSYVTRTIAGTTDEIVVTNGDGIGGNPTVSLAAEALAGLAASGVWLSGTVSSGQVIYGKVVSTVDLKNWSLASTTGASGSVALDVWVHATNKPTVSDSIVDTGTKPSLSAAEEDDGTTADWTTTTITAGSRVAIKVDSLSGITDISFSVTG